MTDTIAIMQDQLKELKKICRSINHIDVALTASNNLSVKEKEYKTNRSKALECAYELHSKDPKFYTPTNLSLNILPHQWNINLPIGIIKEYINKKENGSIGKD